MPDRSICLLEPVFWGFCGDFVEESVYAFTGHRFLNYITVTSMYQLDNEHIDPRNHFLVSSEQLINTQQHGANLMVLERIEEKVDRVDERLSDHVDWHLTKKTPKF